MPTCGSQVILCGLPIRFDTYSGCSHLCRYCFAQRRVDLNEIKTCETIKALALFLEGKRTRETMWCDWPIPIHWGGLSDPFQPIEKEKRNSYECLKLFAATKYPFVVSTKGRLIVTPPYLELLQNCDCVVQISMICSRFDVLEPGAPSFEERISMVETLARVVPRVIVRIQPYLCEVYSDVFNNLRRFAGAGAYGVIIEGMKFAKKKPGLIKVGGDYVFSKEQMEKDFRRLKMEAHRSGLKFYCGENRLRGLGDSLTCCGIDGLKGFQPNEFNLCHMLNGRLISPTNAMKKKNTASCFSSLNQSSAAHLNLREKSFEVAMREYYADRPEYIQKMFGLIS